MPACCGFHFRIPLTLTLSPEYRGEGTKPDCLNHRGPTVAAPNVARPAPFCATGSAARAARRRRRRDVEFFPTARDKCRTSCRRCRGRRPTDTASTLRRERNTRRPAQLETETKPAGDRR